ncbi:MAG: 3-phosphoserine/phosphohydroxythreonine transaminase [Firmicutes bacterium]|nr:3-phosphoserine/phosphohydroxythreonine transaminase [Bacillota bacterium]
MTERVYNFSAGPSMLPLDVIEDAAKNLANYNGCGQSVMEMSHRSKEFQKIIDDAESCLRRIMNIPDNYKVLFLQGGGTLQFAMVPMNLMTKSGKADYIVTGTWAKKAAAEAKKFGDAKVIATSEDSKFTYIPRVTKDDIRPDADYVYIATNNTIYGTHFCENAVPETGDIPLVADMSSCILSEEIDVSKYGLIFAGAQKNVAPAGVTIVIVREDLLGNAPENIPTYLDYKIHADNGSMYNTPPCFAIYIAGEVFKKIEAEGGIGKMNAQDVAKAEKLYNYIDESKLYKCPVENKDDRSLMNVVFVTGDADLDKKFVAEAKEEGLVNLAGHRSIGGMRASIYNAMPMEGVDALISFMKKFEAENL